MCNYCLYWNQLICDFVPTEEPLNKASFSHFILTVFINIKLVLEKTCFQRGFELYKNISFIKKNVEETSKTETGYENLTSI